MSDKLKPCAHCGGVGEIERWSHVDWTEWRVICGRCGTSPDWYTSPEQAIAAWNTRADEPQVIKNAESYKLADDSRPQVIAASEKHELADSREKLNEELMDSCLTFANGGGHLLTFANGGGHLRAFAYVSDLLDRQAAITRAEVFEDGEYDRMTFDELTAERAELRERLDATKAVLDKWVKSTVGVEPPEYPVAQLQPRDGDSREKLEADTWSECFDPETRTYTLPGDLLVPNSNQLEPDSREKLEADLRECVRNVLDDGAYETRKGQLIDESLVNAWMPVFIQRLDRQAAITSLEWLDGKTHIFGMTFDEVRGLQAKVAELTAERDKLRKELKLARIDWESERDYADQCEQHAKELTAELDACRMREKAADDYDFREAAQRWEQAFEDKCGEVVRLTAERDELSRDLDAEHALVVQFEYDNEELKAESDKLKAKVDELNASWRKANDGWAEANAEAERLQHANNTLRASVAGLKMTVERFKARESGDARQSG